MAEVLAFYGLGWQELIDMEFAWFCTLAKRIPVVEARRQLAWVRVVAFPHVEAEARERIQQDLLRQSGYAKQRDEQEAAARYAAGWAALRALGRPAQPSTPTPPNGISE